MTDAYAPNKLAAHPEVLADLRAGGPRGGECDWAAASEPFFRFWRKRGKIPLTEDERREDYWK